MSNVNALLGPNSRTWAIPATNWHRELGAASSGWQRLRRAVTVPGRLSAVSRRAPQLIASASLHVDTAGVGFIEITDHAVKFLVQCEAGDGALFAYLRHTSAALAIQENADPDVRADLLAALDRLAPEDAPWVHDVEGPDDMPAHVKTLISGVSLHIPVADGKLTLGTWQGLYLVEYRRRPQRREVIFQFLGSRK